jgi:hypothetical protein
MDFLQGYVKVTRNYKNKNADGEYTLRAFM